MTEPETLKNNAYHILGLDTAASKKDIVRRSNEIINRLKIGDLPVYDLDTGLFDGLRTEESVKQAVEKLRVPKKRIKEYFFWFQITDAVDEQAFGLLRTKGYISAIRVWQDASKDKGAKSYFYRKNLAVLYCLLLTSEDNNDYLRDSLSIWKELVESDRFWPSFAKAYSLHDEHTASPESITDFKDNVANYISDIYTGLYQIHNNTEYISQSIDFFPSAKGELIDKTIFRPVCQEIDDAIKKLEKVKIGKDGAIDNDKIKKVKALVGVIQGKLNLLIDLGLYDDTQTKIMRDHTTEALRSVARELHNKLGETEKAVSLLKVALNIVGTVSLGTEIEQDIKTLERIRDDEESVNPIVELIENEEYEQALQAIENDRVKHNSNAELQKMYFEQTRICVYNLAIQKYNKARELLDNRDESGAKQLFIEAGQLVYGHINVFGFNRKAIDKVLASEETRVAEIIKTGDADAFNKYRNVFLKHATEQFQGQIEEFLYMVLVDSRIFVALCSYVSKKKKSDFFEENMCCIIPAAGFAILFIIGMIISAFDSCK